MHTASAQLCLIAFFVRLCLTRRPPPSLSMPFPQVYEQLRRLSVLAEAGDDTTLESMDLTFEISVSTPGPKGHHTRDVSLKPGGESTLVCAANCLEFVELYSKYLMEGEVYEQLVAIRDGLCNIIPPHFFIGISAEDLQLLLNGKITLDLATLREHIIVQLDQGARPEMADWFWSALESFASAELSKFLYFATGSLTIPVESAEAFSIEIRFTAHDYEMPLPTSATCSREIFIPSYLDREMLKQKLLFAIQNCDSYQVSF